MRSFLKEIEDKFLELEAETSDKEHDEDADLEEQNVAAAIAGYNTPNAFRKTVKKVDYASGIEESVNTPPTYKFDPFKDNDQYQKPESEEEEYMDKFAYAGEEDWQHAKYEYPSKNLVGTPGTATKHKHMVEDAMERKYEQLIEGYRDFKSGDVQPSRKVKESIREIAKRLREIETIVNYSSKFKNEAGVTSDAYGPSTTKALQEISKRLIKISERVRSLGE